MKVVAPAAPDDHLARRRGDAANDDVDDARRSPNLLHICSTAARRFLHRSAVDAVHGSCRLPIAPKQPPGSGAPAHPGEAASWVGAAMAARPRCPEAWPRPWKAAVNGPSRGGKRPWRRMAKRHALATGRRDAGAGFDTSAARPVFACCQPAASSTMAAAPISPELSPSSALTTATSRNGGSASALMRAAMPAERASKPLAMPPPTMTRRGL